MTKEQKGQKELLHMFAAYLTSIDPAIRIGRNQSVQIMVELLERFCKRHGLTEDKK